MFRLICSLRSRSCVAALAARLFTIRREIARAIANATTSMMPLDKLITQYSTGAKAPNTYVTAILAILRRFSHATTLQ